MLTLSVSVWTAGVGKCFRKSDWYLALIPDTVDCWHVVSRHVNCQLSLQKSRRASSERFHALPSTTLSNFHSDSLDRLLRNGLFVSRHGYWTELSGPLCWFVSRHGYWNVEKQKSCQLSISLQQSGRASAERVVEVRVEDVRVVEVQFYPQVWH